MAKRKHPADVFDLMSRFKAKEMRAKNVAISDLYVDVGNFKKMLKLNSEDMIDLAAWLIQHGEFDLS